MKKKSGGFVMRFEEKRFCRITTLAERWDCSTRRIYDLLSKGIIRAWHPEGKVGIKGVMIEVRSVVEAEDNNQVHPE